MAVHDKLALGVALGLTSLSTIIVALRFYCRFVLAKKLSSPDWMMLFALRIATWGSTVVNYYQVKFLDYSHVTDEASYKPVAVGSLLTWWIYRIFYILDQCLIKVSILLFYNFITKAHKSFRRIVKSLMVVVLASSFGMLIAAIFACNPPSDAWSYEVFVGPFKGIFPTQCYRPEILWYFSASFGLCTDCIIWILPIPFILNLRSMNMKRRLELAGTFSVGIVAITASAVRLWVVTQWLASFEGQGRNTCNLLIWGQVEQHAGIIAASIPFLRPLARILLKQARRHASPSPPAEVVRQNFASDHKGFQQRPPIIPSPSPTFGSSNAPIKLPSSPLMPLSPLSPIQPHLMKGATV